MFDFFVFLKYKIRKIKEKGCKEKCGENVILQEKSIILQFNAGPQI